MKKGLSLFLLFFASVFISMIYQSCGDSTLKANSSNNDGLKVEVVPDGGGDEEGNGDGSGDGGDGSGGNGDGFSFDLGAGDNIFYVDGGFSPDLKTVRLLGQLYYTVLESHVYEQAGVAFTADLPASFCQNSAFPHCSHLDNAPCVGLGCFDTNRPVRCHWQSRMSNAQVSNTFQALNGVRFLARNVSPEDPMISDCDNPNLFFYSDSTSLQVSLADRACIPNGKYFASAGGDVIESILDTELDRVDSQGDFCNNYSIYAWNTTKWSYTAQSGQQIDRVFREVSYENALVDIRWKDQGDSKIYCANNVFVNPPGVDVFFPSTGLSYQIFRTEATVNEPPTAEITYEDPVDGGTVRRFFLDEISAQNNSGGVVLDTDQASAMRAQIEVFVSRAKALNLDQECP